MRRILLILVATVAIVPPDLEAQHDPDIRAGRFFVGSSAFVAANLTLAGRPDAPDFYQLNAGYWLTDKWCVVLAVGGAPPAGALALRCSGGIRCCSAPSHCSRS
jgi:hypothetical protein